MSLDKVYIERVDYVIALGQKTARTQSVYSDNRVDSASFNEFRSMALSFIGNLYGEHNPYYVDFNDRVNDTWRTQTSSGLGILNAIKTELEKGWLSTLKGLVSAELFSDFLEMSDHFLQEGYKDAAAVMIGSTLEEHLRQLCDVYKVDNTMARGLDQVPKKADVLNADLKKAGVYGAIDQKQITAWLGIRNSAAHGKYDEYTKEQVKGMYDGVLNFVSRVK